MVYVVIAILLLCLIGVALYAFLARRESNEYMAAMQAEYEKILEALRAEQDLAQDKTNEQLAAVETRHERRLEALQAKLNLTKRESYEHILSVKAEYERSLKALQTELNALEKIRHIPGVIEQTEQNRDKAETQLAEATRRAIQIGHEAQKEAERRGAELTASAEDALERAKKIQRDAKDKADALLHEARSEARSLVDAAQAEAKSLASEARKFTREKNRQTEESLDQALRYAIEIRLQADRRAELIAGRAKDVAQKLDDYRAALDAVEHQLSKYDGFEAAPTPHLFDELADDFGFTDPGAKLKLARRRTTKLLETSQAATCGYEEGWKRDHALKFVLGTFNGKVDSILARVKEGNDRRLAQEIRDAYALVNKDGEVYKNARITPEYLDARLDELKQAVAVYRIKEQQRDEQRAIREQIREEERARREIEKAVKQARKEEELVTRALEQARRDYEQASEDEAATYRTKLEALELRLKEAEARGQRALSMAQQTKQGHVYVISNIGSFGENVYKIGLTRRLDPTDRVRELGDASVPFPFDIHAMIHSEDAPALEHAIHQEFMDRQLNKINKRKEFFRIDLTSIRRVVETMNLNAEWTLAATATQYRESQALEQAMKADPALRKRWEEEQKQPAADLTADEEAEEAAEALA